MQQKLSERTTKTGKGCFSMHAYLIEFSIQGAISVVFYGNINS